ncbi:TerC family protein [Paenibacillus cisolokensis]|jgi:integral membrane protein, YjbE family|uniref:TerC family protein n=1 Tax=Paenibacillus TaxID=44249 RepID=UPI0007225DE5|nr:TerC family protein [Paenibacillus sp. 32O-W]ALS27325.1 membrane protein [Paenibacillus sp. 32O-W]
MDQVLLFAEILLINILLSGDNAIVIAMASSRLPPHQRKQAIWWGTAAAIALRCAMTAVALALLAVPFLQAVGAVLLFAIAVKLLTDAENNKRTGTDIRRAGSLRAAVRTIVAADLIMSLDNVLAIAAIAQGEPVLIVLGIVLTIPVIIWGSHMLTTLLEKVPFLVYAGAGLLGYAAGEMLVRDEGLNRLLLHGSATASEAIPLLSIPLVIVVAMLRIRFASR